MAQNFNITNSNPAFRGIHAVSGGKQLLERTLNKTERLELKKLIDLQKNNPVDVIIAQSADKRLYGWTVFEEKTTGAYHRKDYEQRLLFDSPLKFIQRLCKKADELHQKHKDDIVPSFCKQFELTIQ